MADDELSDIRARRMAQLQQQSGGGGGPGGRNLMGGQGGPMGGGSSDGGKQEEKRQQAMEDMKNSILTQVLTQEARARLNTLMIAKPEKGAMIEANLIRMAQTGQLAGRLSEEELIGLLERFSDSGMHKKTKVNFDRRRAALDSDED